jgi:tetratricopeptide (TPR) repeat protein
MARRRFNTRFVYIFGLVVLLAGGGVVAVYKVFHTRQNPEQLRQAGKTAMQNKDFHKAVELFGVASQILPQDADLHCLLGKAYLADVTLGLDRYNQATTEFTRAAQLDQNSKEAWTGLLETGELRLEYWEAHSSGLQDTHNQLPASINLAREAAVRLLGIDKNNLLAQESISTLVIRAWLLNLQLPDVSDKTPDATPVSMDPAAGSGGAPGDDPQKPQDEPKTVKVLSADERAEQAIVDLTKMMREHPEDERLPFWIASAKISQAQRALRSEQPSDANPLFAEAAGEFDASIAAKPANLVPLYLGKAKILANLQLIDPNPNSTQLYLAKRREALQLAQAAADPANKADYRRAKMEWAQLVGRSDSFGAEKIYDDLIEKFPDDVQVRLALAELLQPDASRRADALKVLNDIFAMPGAKFANPMEQEVWEENLAVGKMLLADIKTDELPETAAGPARDKLVAEIRDALASAAKKFADSPQLLRVQGRFELTNGQIVNAVQTLNHAVDRMVQEGTQPDYTLLNLEVQADKAAGQTGQAITIMEGLRNNGLVANTFQFHYEIANLYLQNKDLVKAKPDIDWLAVRYPNEPPVIALQITDLGSNPEPAVYKPLFDRLPETNEREIENKYATAAVIHDVDDGIRLEFLIHKAKPGDGRIAFNLATVLHQMHRDPEARQVIADYKAVHPDDPAVKPIEDLLASVDVKAVNNETLEIAKATPDPFQRALKLAQIYHQMQEPDLELAELQKAVAIQPDNGNLLQRVFTMQLNAGNLPEAEAMLPHLAEVDNGNGADSAKGLMFREKLLLAKQDVPNSLVVGRQLTHDYANFAASWELYGEALENAGQWDAAAQQYSRALDLAANNPEALTGLIRCSVIAGKTEDARQYIATARTRYPDDPAFRQIHARFEMQNGDPVTILPEMLTAVKDQPEVPGNYALATEAMLACVSSSAAKGDATAASDYQTKAEDLCRDALKRWPDSLAFANQLASMLAEAGEVDKAADVMKTISQRQQWKDQPAPLLQLARIYLKAKQPLPAEQAVNQASALGCNPIEAALVLSECKLQEQKPDDAKAVLFPVKSAYPAFLKYINILLQSKDGGPQAEVELSQAVKAHPDDARLLDLQLHVFDAEGQYDQGLRAAEAAINADHTHIMAYFWRGKFEASGPHPDYDAAIKDLGYFRDSVPNDVNGRLVLAGVMEAKGDADGAIHELETAISFAPQAKEVRMHLLQDYLAAVPHRDLDAETLLNKTLALPAFAKDWEVESKAALLWAQEKKTDQAVAEIRKAMADVPEAQKGLLVHDYFYVLLQANTSDNNELLLKESEKYASDPRTSWFVFNDRGMAKAALGDSSGAAAEFQIALDRCGIENSDADAHIVVSSLSNALGIDKALELVLPRAQNSTAWKMIAISLYITKKDYPNAIKLADAALPTANGLTPEARMQLFRDASVLYLTANPPMADRAMDVFQRMLAINPDDVDALNSMACVASDYSAHPDLAQALTWSQHAFDIIQKSGHVDPRIYDTQGWILIQSGQPNEGIDVLHQVIDQADFPDIHYHLAVGYLKIQRPEDAKQELTAASDVISRKKAVNEYVDPSLTAKIASASKEADDMIKAK